MKIYDIQVSYGYNLTNHKLLTVAGNTIEKAIQDAKRWANKSYWTDATITRAEFVKNIDVFYKS